MQVRNSTKTLMDQDELVSIVEEKLKQHGVTYKMLHHEPEGNCDKVSLLRGNHIHAAAKALLIHVKISNKANRQVLAILPGDKKVDFQVIAAIYQGKMASMAERSKVESLMNCEIGRVPPFSFNKQVSLLVDEDLVNDNEFIYFSPGRLDASIEMRAEDYRKIALADDAKILKFSSKVDSIYHTAAPLFAAAPAKTAEAPTADLANSNQNSL